MKKRKLKKKPIIFLICMAIAITIGTTYAYYYTHYAIENNFKLADYNITLEEYFPNDVWDADNNLDKVVTVSNEGNADVFLRVSYNEMWYEEEEDGSKRFLNNLYENKEIVTKNWNEEFDNFVYKDGWYYYTKILSKGDSVTILDSITKNYNIYDLEDIKYQLDFNYEVLQVENYASKRVWGYDTTVKGDSVTWEF